MTGCGGFGHAWNYTPGRWGFLWLRKGGHQWCYHCGLKMPAQPPTPRLSVRQLSDSAAHASAEPLHDLDDVAAEFGIDLTEDTP